MITYQRLRQDRSCRTITFAVFGLIFNFLYAFYHGALGIVNHSIWFITSCIYYLLLGTMRFTVIISNCNENPNREYAVMKLTGILFSILSLILSGIIYLSLSQQIAAKYGEITMITIATYTFTKIIMAIIKAVKYQKINSPLINIIQNISYAEVAVSIFTMQRSMLVSFGEMDPAKSIILNIFTGTVIWLFTLTLGIIMIKNSKKKDEDLTHVKIKNFRSK